MKCAGTAYKDVEVSTLHGRKVRDLKNSHFSDDFVLFCHSAKAQQELVELGNQNPDKTGQCLCVVISLSHCVRRISCDGLSQRCGTSNYHFNSVTVKYDHSQRILEIVQALMELAVEQVSGVLQFRLIQRRESRVTYVLHAEYDRHFLSRQISTLYGQRTPTSLEQRLMANNRRVQSPSSGHSELIRSDLKVEKLLMAALLPLINDPGLDNGEGSGANGEDTCKERLEIVDYVAPSVATALAFYYSRLAKKYWCDQRGDYNEHSKNPQSGFLIPQHFALLSIASRLMGWHPITHTAFASRVNFVGASQRVQLNKQIIKMCFQFDLRLNETRKQLLPFLFRAGDILNLESCLRVVPLLDFIADCFLCRNQRDRENAHGFVHFSLLKRQSCIKQIGRAFPHTQAKQFYDICLNVFQAFHIRTKPIKWVILVGHDLIVSNTKFELQNSKIASLRPEHSLNAKLVRSDLKINRLSVPTVIFRFGNPHLADRERCGNNSQNPTDDALIIISPLSPRVFDRKSQQRKYEVLGNVVIVARGDCKGNNPYEACGSETASSNPNRPSQTLRHEISHDFPDSNLFVICRNLGFRAVGKVGNSSGGKLGPKVHSFNGTRGLVR